MPNPMSPAKPPSRNPDFLVWELLASTTDAAVDYAKSTFRKAETLEASVKWETVLSAARKLRTALEEVKPHD